MAAYVKCPICGKQFNREKIPFVKMGRRYAHIECAAQEKGGIVLRETNDKDRFFEMVKHIYGPKYNFILINKQATDYIEQYHYTWSGMTACLHWFYNINHRNPEEGNGGIGIIPYIYDQVRDYYNKIYKAQKKNQEVATSKQEVKFNISSPRSSQAAPHLLDLEDV